LSSPVINTLSQPARTNTLERIEAPAAALTLTRTAVQAITTAGTLITWQSATRNTGFSWTGTDITIPTAGYYVIQTRIATAASITLATQVTVNGTTIGYFGNTYVATTYHTGTIMRYHATGDVLQIRVVPSANTNINQAAENTLTESPLLHIVQLTRPVL